MSLPTGRSAAHSPSSRRPRGSRAARRRSSFASATTAMSTATARPVTSTWPIQPAGPSGSAARAGRLSTTRRSTFGAATGTCRSPCPSATARSSCSGRTSTSATTISGSWSPGWRPRSGPSAPIRSWSSPSTAAKTSTAKVLRLLIDPRPQLAGPAPKHDLGRQPLAAGLRQYQRDTRLAVRRPVHAGHRRDLRGPPFVARTGVIHAQRPVILTGSRSS